MKNLFLCFLLIASPVFSCTGISIQTQDKKHIQARTIEWGEFPLGSKLIISPKNQEFQSLTPEGKNGIKWKAKYGFVGISVASNDFIGEGMNEAGLNAGLFYFAHYGSLAPYDPKDSKNSISDMELTKYILSNFKSVSEVKEAFKTLKVVPFMLEDGKAPPTAHWRVSDANGENIVIEIIEGIVKIYDNSVGVLTNSPDFQWHLTNLNNFINLHAGSAEGFMMGDRKLFAMGSGTGLFGLPGDFTPPSRFVRASFFLHTAPTPKNSYEGITQAFHILNLFDLPIGTEFENKSKIPSTLPSATQWTAVSNLGDLEFFYHTMHNRQIRKIDLKKINFLKTKWQALMLDKKSEEEFEEVKIR
ncbi:Penicillin V acylase and related amidases [Helicobacter pametensis]|nr:Penicillin V acylase and related amidases [Helicobacter pametensis]